jgi:UDP-glucose 4-epimerase
MKASIESNLSGKKIAIVGGSGFVGSNIAGSLSKDFDVMVLDVSPPPFDVAQHVSFRECDVRDYNALKEDLLGVDLVINTAIIQIPLISKSKRQAYEVNVVGTQNICRAVDEIDSVRALLLSGSWHVIGERGLQGRIDESFGYRPDMVDSRSREYVLCKMAQEAIVRLYNEMSPKAFVTLRLGTVLGEGMPKETAANIFISNAIEGKSITPFSHSASRPMLYVDIRDVCLAFRSLVKVLLSNGFEKQENVCHTLNVFYPSFITIMELAKMVRDSVRKLSHGSIKPDIKVVETDLPKVRFLPGNRRPTIDVSNARKLLRMKQLTHPRFSIERIVKRRMQSASAVQREA